VIPANSVDKICYDGNFIVSRVDLVGLGRDLTAHQFRMVDIRSGRERDAVVEICRQPVLQFNPNDVQRRLVANYDRPTGTQMMCTPTAITGLQALDAVSRMHRRSPFYE
jgi:hypothetical protein